MTSRPRRKDIGESAFSDGDGSLVQARHGLSASFELGDLELAAGHQAVAIPPGSISIPPRKHFGAHAPLVARVGKCVRARCRESRKIPRRLATSNPGLVAGSAARLAPTVAIDGDSLKPGKLLHCRTRPRYDGFCLRARECLSGS